MREYSKTQLQNWYEDVLYFNNMGFFPSTMVPWIKWLTEDLPVLFSTERNQIAINRLMAEIARRYFLLSADL